MANRAPASASAWSASSWSVAAIGFVTHSFAPPELLRRSLRRSGPCVGSDRKGDVPLVTIRLCGGRRARSHSPSSERPGTGCCQRSGLLHSRSRRLDIASPMRRTQKRRDNRARSRSWQTSSGRSGLRIKKTDVPVRARQVGRVPSRAGGTVRRWVGSDRRKPRCWRRVWWLSGFPESLRHVSSTPHATCLPSRPRIPVAHVLRFGLALPRATLRPSTTRSATSGR